MEKMNTKEKIKILIVDDNEEILEMYRSKFQKDSESFEVFTESNGLKAIPLANEVEPDVILLDIMMPNLDGIETLNVIRKYSTFDPLVIFFSNLSEDQYIKKSMGMEADYFFSKAEHTPNEILNKVKEIIYNKYLQKG